MSEKEKKSTSRAVQSPEQYKHSGKAWFTYLFLIFYFLRFDILEENFMETSSFLDPALNGHSRKRSL